MTDTEAARLLQASQHKEVLSRLDAIERRLDVLQANCLSLWQALEELNPAVTVKWITAAGHAAQLSTWEEQVAVMDAASGAQKNDAAHGPVKKA